MKTRSEAQFAMKLYREISECDTTLAVLREPVNLKNFDVRIGGEHVLVDAPGGYKVCYEIRAALVNYWVAHRATLVDELKKHGFAE